jgi:putative membrane protein
MNVKMYITLTLLLLIVIFTVQNAAVVTVNFLFWKLEISRALLIFFVLVIGVIIGWISHSHMHHTKNRKQSIKPGAKE